MDFEKIATDAAFKMGIILKDKQKEAVVLLLKGNDVLTAWFSSPPRLLACFRIN